MAEDERNSTHTPALSAPGDQAGDALAEVASILAGAMLRLRGRRAGTAKKREISRDNPLGGPGETRPPAVNLQRKG